MSIDRSVDIAEWLDGLPVFVSSFSTMTVDAMIRQTTISPKIWPVREHRFAFLQAALTNRFCLKPGSVSEAADLVKQAFRDELPVSPDEESCRLL